MTAATQSLSATAWKDANYAPDIGRGGAIHFYRYPAVTVATTATDEANDVFELATLPAGITVLGFMVTAADLDSNVSPALVYKLRINAVDLVTGVTTGQAAGTSVHWCAPTTTAGLEVADAKVTTPAGTAAEGAVTLGIFYTT